MSYTVIHGRLHRNVVRWKDKVCPSLTAKQLAKDKAKQKGIKGGNCNVTACQRPGAAWWNTSTRCYYCTACAREINRWSRHDEGYDICYPSMEAVIAAKAKFTGGYQGDQAAHQESKHDYQETTKEGHRLESH